MLKVIIVISFLIIAFIAASIGADIIDDAAGSIGLKPSEDSSWSNSNNTGLVTVVLFGLIIALTTSLMKSK